MTQRTFPRMALFKLSIVNSQLTIRHGQHSLGVPLENDSLLNPMQVSIWDDTVSAFEVDVAYSKWFSDLLEIRQNRQPCLTLRTELVSRR